MINRSESELIARERANQASPKRGGLKKQPPRRSPAGAKSAKRDR